MFSQVCVTNSVLKGGMHGRGHAWQGVCMQDKQTLKQAVVTIVSNCSFLDITTFYFTTRVFFIKRSCSASVSISVSVF